MVIFGGSVVFVSWSSLQGGEPACHDCLVVNTPGGQALSRNDDEHRCVSSLSSTPGSSRVAKHLGCPQRQENTAFPYRVS